jgi:hypothetical protein
VDGPVVDGVALDLQRRDELHGVERAVRLGLADVDVLHEELDRRAACRIDGVALLGRQVEPGGDREGVLVEPCVDVRHCVGQLVHDAARQIRGGAAVKAEHGSLVELGRVGRCDISSQTDCGYLQGLRAVCPNLGQALCVTARMLLHLETFQKPLPARD